MLVKPVPIKKPKCSNKGLGWETARELLVMWKFVFVCCMWTVSNLGHPTGGSVSGRCLS